MKPRLPHHAAPPHLPSHPETLHHCLAMCLTAATPPALDSQHWAQIGAAPGPLTCFMAHFCYSAPVVGADRTGPCDSSVNSGITGGSFLQVLLLTSSPILTFQRRCNCPSGVYAVSCGGGTVTAASSWYPYPRASLVWRFPPCYKCATDFF